ncbi:hypothetical protein [Sphingomonas sp. IW22]|uniref:hypothetical protein n=1 Tax=Sphingomonas sp. IW22 TaxID=3242489 RepID=UPI003522F567
MLANYMAVRRENSLPLYGFDNCVIVGIRDGRDEAARWGAQPVVGFWNEPASTRQFVLIGKAAQHAAIIGPLSNIRPHVDHAPPRIRHRAETGLACRSVSAQAKERVRI